MFPKLTSVTGCILVVLAGHLSLRTGALTKSSTSDVVISSVFSWIGIMIVWLGFFIPISSDLVGYSLQKFLLDSCIILVVVMFTFTLLKDRYKKQEAQQ